MTTTARACFYNPITNTLSLSEAFIKKASRMGTAEYKMVVQYQKDHPGLTINEMEKKTSEKKALRKDAAAEPPKGKRVSSYSKSRPSKDNRPKQRAKTNPYAHSRPVKKGKGSFRKKEG